MTVSVDEVALDSDYAPVIGSNVAVDAGATDLVPDTLLSSPDVNGGQRIYNGTIDIGAVEADWRPTYAAALGALVSVTAATENVTLADGKVRLSSDDSITGTWAPVLTTMTACYSALVEESGGGTLSGEFTDGNGGTLASMDVSSGSETALFRAKGLTVGFAFAYDGDGYGCLSAFNAAVPGAILIVR